VFSIKIRVSERQVIYSFPNLMGHHSLHNADSSSAVSNREEQVDESQWEEGNVDIDPMMLGDGVLTQERRDRGPLVLRAHAKSFENTLKVRIHQSNLFRTVGIRACTVHARVERKI